MADQTFAVHCGFFDAINSDRTYSADEMNRPYKRVISNGVFATPNGTPSTDLQVTASSGMNIICKKGEGLFGDKWFENPSGIAITVPSNTGTVPRIDSVLVQVDTRTSGRVGNIVHRTGTPASSPVPPAINQTEGVVEYRLANIRVNAGVSAITQSMITDRRGSSDCPWVTSLIYQVDTSTLYDQWAAAYAEYFEEEKAIWDAWYSQLTEDLDVSMTLDRHTNTVTTTAQTTGTIPIGLAYNHNTDILEVYINGLRAVEGTHYVVVDGDTSIQVENQLQIGQEVTFVVMRSVISGSATNIMVLLQELESQIAGIAGGTPTVVDSTSDMTDTEKIYILSSDSKWYYYSATQEDWVIGGTYGGVPTDTTLTQPGMAADAKSVGDALATKADADDVEAIDTRVTSVETGLVYISQKTKNLINIKPLSDGSVKGLDYESGLDNHILISGTTTGTNADSKFPLVSSISLEANKTYCVSFTNGFNTTSVSATVYLRSNNATVAYGAVSRNTTYFVFTLDADATIDEIWLRVASANVSVNIDTQMQLELGDVPSTYISPITANDKILADKIKEIELKSIDVVFSNGYFKDNYPAYDNNSSCCSWIITDEIIHVKKGSSIAKYGSATMYFVIKEYNSAGEYTSELFSGNLSSLYTFADDAYVRMAVRAVDYSYLIPTSANANYRFSIYSDTELSKDVKVFFIGIGKGQNVLSGQCQLIRFPNGKNMLIDSHLVTYYTGLHDRLRDCGVRRIDYYVQSHYHRDHCGLLGIYNNNPTWIDIEGATVYLPQLITAESISQISDASDLLQRQTDMINMFNACNCTIVRPTDEQVVKLWDKASLQFYNADHSVYSDSEGSYYSTNYNDWSLCCYLLYGLNAINFSADIGPIGQRKVGGTLDKATILTAPHHGWDNGANNLYPAFINNVNPDTVISVNGWEHNPDNANSAANIMLATSAMQSFCEANCVSNYCTFNNGMIKILLNEYGWKFDGHYSRFIRNGKNWKFNDNTDKVES